MKIREVMTKQVIRIGPAEPVSVAARTLERFNIGSLPVCTADGRLCGLVTDRDLVIRCIAAGKDPGKTPVEQVMTANVTCVRSDMDTCAVAALMGKKQIRRLPVVDNGRLCGMVSLGDLAGCQETEYEATDALAMISNNLSSR